MQKNNQQYNHHGRLLAIAFLLMLFTVQGCQKINFTSGGEKIDWHNLTDGQTEAAKLNLPVLVDFYYGPQCPRCSAFDQHIYSDPGIISRLNTQFVAIRIDLRKPLNKQEKALADTMKTGGECMLMFLNSAGKIVKTKQGGPICTMDQLTIKEFSVYLDQALAHLAD